MLTRTIYSLDIERLISVYLQHSLPVVNEMLKKDLTVREHLKTIQSDGGKARWAKLTPEERSAQARKIVAARWAKRITSEVPPADAATKPKKSARKKPRANN